MFNIINGGKHADSGLDIQEYMVVPFGIHTFAEKLRAGVEIFYALGNILKKRNLSTAVADEGGFAPKLKSNQEPFELIYQAVESAGYKMGEQIGIALDAAACSFYDKGKYHLRLDNKILDREELIDLYDKWIDQFSIISIEDGLEENDWNGWRQMTNRLRNRVRVIGDDFLVTNLERLKRAVEEECATGILIKLNQIGTLTEAIECLKFAEKSDWWTIVSHRSGETCDTFIADFVVGTNARRIKAGSTCRGERISKYNRILEIGAELEPQRG
jgi:enolase